MSFWDSLMKAFKQGGNNSYGSGGGSAGSLLRPKGYKRARSTGEGKPSNNRANRNRANRAASARYQGQANLQKKRAAAERNKPIPFTGRAVEPSDGGMGGGGYGDGSSALDDVMNQIANMSTPDVTIPQIDVASTLARMFDPQFKEIAKQEARTKKEGSANAKEIKAAYKALEESISKDDAKEIDKSYKQATKENNAAGKQAEESMSDAMKLQAEERRKDAQNLGIETALAQDSSAQNELAKGLKDAAESTKSQNSRLQELKKADEVLNRDAAQTAAFQGNESVSALKAQVADILAGLGERRSNTQSAKGEARLNLETQNQNAVTAAQAEQTKNYEAMLDAQAEMIKDAQGLDFDYAKLMSDREAENAKNNMRQYEIDTKAATQQEKNAAKNQTVLDQLAALRPGGLGTKSLQGVMSNMDSFYASGKGTWPDALQQYIKKYPKSARSIDAAKEYARIVGKR